MRDPILRAAELLAGKGYLPEAHVAKIRAGTGKFDKARDGIALVLLFARNAAKVAGKHPFTAEDFTTLREATEWLMDRLTPAGAKKAPAARRDDEDLRDRFWTLLVERHPDLRVMGWSPRGSLAIGSCSGSSPPLVALSVNSRCRDRADTVVRVASPPTSAGRATRRSPADRA